MKMPADGGDEEEETVQVTGNNNSNKIYFRYVRCLWFSFRQKDVNNFYKLLLTRARVSVCSTHCVLYTYVWEVKIESVEAK